MSFNPDPDNATWLKEQTNALGLKSTSFFINQIIRSVRGKPTIFGFSMNTGNILNEIETQKSIKQKELDEYFDFCFEDKKRIKNSRDGIPFDIKLFARDIAINKIGHPVDVNLLKSEIQKREDQETQKKLKDV